MNTALWKCGTEFGNKFGFKCKRIRSDVFQLAFMVRCIVRFSSNVTVERLSTRVNEWHCSALNLVFFLSTFKDVAYVYSISYWLLFAEVFWFFFLRSWKMGWWFSCDSERIQLHMKCMKIFKISINKARRRQSYYNISIYFIYSFPSVCLSLGIKLPISWFHKHVYIFDDSSTFQGISSFANIFNAQAFNIRCIFMTQVTCIHFLSIYFFLQISLTNRMPCNWCAHNSFQCYQKKLWN